MNLAKWLQRSAMLTPDAPALLHGTEVVATYAAFADRAARIAAGLRRAGVEPGERIALFMPNRPDYLAIWWGAWWAGAAVVPINAKLHPKEAGYIADHAGARLVAVTDASLDLGVPLATPATIDALAAAEPMPEPEPLADDALAWLFYTSGTTGRPKGVMLTVANLVAMSLTYLADVDEVHPTDAALYAAPMSHGAGCYNLMHVMKGARHVVPASGGFDPAEILALAGTLGEIHMFAAPTMVRRLITHAQAVGHDGTGIRTIVYGGGPMYVADIEAAVARFGPRFVQIYGQGETPMTITALPRPLVADRAHPRWRERLGSVGIAMSSMEVRTVDADGRDVGVDAIGEVICRGPSVMRGYWENPEATAATLRDGWLWTGDMGALDAEGFLTLKDRSKDMIVSGGTNIYPREVEEVLLTHPDVAEVAVVGRPHPDWGEEVVAFVVGRTGPVDPAALDALCQSQIARFKRPKAYFAIEALPKNNYGKVLKTALRENLAAMPV
ncbi:AMP-binding protein [Acuticoccus sp. I52.16.1]|uniref:AMP-binding protein n=1 Tax=Acuticoccus sp. I52.16.1 TaxID=2928472 RepID=UPI001FD3DE56|nr:AMP-binding protein [Acuticoccus sp. I52.16.1]UOM33194.1 AMP-binding protein [Acuticoccus sp. I52.16.1]